MPMLYGSQFCDVILLDCRCTSLTVYAEGNRTNVDLATVMFRGQKISLSISNDFSIEVDIVL